MKAMKTMSVEMAIPTQQTTDVRKTWKGLYDGKEEEGLTRKVAGM